jgi:hypothetical protein
VQSLIYEGEEGIGEGVYGDYIKLHCDYIKCLSIYQLPNGLIKVRRRWGQRHPQGANLGSNGKLNSRPTHNIRLPPAHSP